MSLKSDIQKLAHQHPELRPHLIPLLKKGNAYNHLNKSAQDFMGNITTWLGYLEQAEEQEDWDSLDGLLGELGQVMNKVEDAMDAMNKKVAGYSRRLRPHLR